MKFIIEFDGALADMASVYYASHRESTAQVDWSCLSESEFWRLTRTKGREAIMLRGAKPNKLERYHQLFDEWLESDAIGKHLELHLDTAETLRRLGRFGEIHPVTLGTNIAIRQSHLDRAVTSLPLSPLVGLGDDARNRPGTLVALGCGSSEGALLVAAATDSLARAAERAGLVVAGIASGTCTRARLQKAGADVVYADLEELAMSIEEGAPDLVRAGLQPASLR